MNLYIGHSLKHGVLYQRKPVEPFLCDEKPCRIRRIEWIPKESPQNRGNKRMQGLGIRLAIRG
jgi:hypothetical protein